MTPTSANVKPSGSESKTRDDGNLESSDEVFIEEAERLVNPRNQAPEATPNEVGDENLVDNINEDDEVGNVEGKPDEGADNIKDDKSELREDLKNDSFGGAPQLGEQQVAEEDEDLPQRSG